MIVTCPKCEARYAVDPLAIGPSGRTVQCARCDNRWFQRVEGPPAPPDLVIRPPTNRGPSSLPVPVEAKPEPRRGKKALATLVVLILLGGAGYATYHFRDRLPLAVSTKLVFVRDKLAVSRDMLIALLPKQLPFFHSDKEAPSSSSAAPAPPRAAAPATPSSSTTAPSTTPPSTTPPAATTPAPAAATAPSTATVPNTTAPSTTAPRVDPPATPAQLEVDLSASKIELVDGRYVVKGEIVNHGGTPGAPTKLTVQFKKGSEVLISRSYPLTLGAIPAGDRQAFSQVLDNPPPGATDIVPSVE